MSPLMETGAATSAENRKIHFMKVTAEYLAINGLKIPRYIEIDVTEGELIDYARIEKECGSEVYQIKLVEGVDYDKDVTDMTSLD